MRDGHVVLRLPATPTSTVPPDEILMSTSDLALPGRHNLYNSLAAAIVARAMEIRSDVVRESLTSFEGVPHRLETVRTVGGVRFVNDSKATNVNAVWYALESFPPIGAGGVRIDISMLMLFVLVSLAMAINGNIIQSI